jgi:hypothetical protein
LLFNHSRSSPVGEEADYDLEYDYRIQSRQGAELSSVTSPVATGRRFLSGVTALTAADREQLDFQELNWEDPPGQIEDDDLSFEVFRDGEFVKTEDGDTDHTLITPETVPDPAVYEYWLVAHCPDGPGEESNHDFGSTICYRRYDIGGDFDNAPCGLVDAKISGLPMLAFVQSDSGSLLCMSALTMSPNFVSAWRGGLIHEYGEDYFVAQPALVEYEGKAALLVYYEHATDTEDHGLHIFLAGKLVPEVPADWEQVKGPNELCVAPPALAATGDGRLCFAYLTGSDIEDTFMTYTLTGEDPTVTQDWEAGTVNAVSLASEPDLALTVFADQPVIVTSDFADLVYYRAGRFESFDTEDWPSHHIDINGVGYRSPSVQASASNIFVSAIKASLGTRAALLFKSSDSSPAAGTDWDSISYSDEDNFQVNYLNCDLCLSPSGAASLCVLGSHGGDDIFDTPTNEGRLIMLQVTATSLVDSIVSLPRVTPGIAAEQFFIPRTENLYHDSDLSLACLDIDGEPMAVLPLALADDATASQPHFFVSEPKVPAED